MEGVCDVEVGWVRAESAQNGEMPGTVGSRNTVDQRKGVVTVASSHDDAQSDNKSRQAGPFERPSHGGITPSNIPSIRPGLG